VRRLAIFALGLFAVGGSSSLHAEEELRISPGRRPGELVIHPADKARFHRMVTEQVRKHEAAHAVVALRLGLALISSEVRPGAVPEATTTGQTIVEIQDTEVSGFSRVRRAAAVFEHAVAILAGLVLTSRMDVPGVVAQIVCEGDTTDLAALGLTPDEEQRARQRASELVEANLPEIEAVARRLEERPRLTGDEVRTVLADMPPSGR
jgi:hypothetical protein